MRVSCTSSRSRPTPMQPITTMTAASRSMRKPLRASHTANPRPSRAGNHLGRHDHEPRQAGRHPQRGDHLRRDGRQRHVAEQPRPPDAEIARHPEVDARDARRRRPPSTGSPGKTAAMKIRKIAGGSPMPSQRMANGIQASGDRLRKKLTSGSSAARARSRSGRAPGRPGCRPPPRAGSRHRRETARPAHPAAGDRSSPP